MAWACNRAKGAPGLMGGMDGQKALEIELLSIQSMDAGTGRRWRPDEVGGLGLHGAAKDEVAGVGLGTKQGRRSSCLGGAARGTAWTRTRCRSGLREPISDDGGGAGAACARAEINRGTAEAAPGDEHVGDRARALLLSSWRHGRAREGESEGSERDGGAAGKREGEIERRESG